MLNVGTELKKHLVKCGIANYINSTVSSHLDSDSGVKALPDTPQNTAFLQGISSQKHGNEWIQKGKKIELGKSHSQCVTQ